MALYYLGVDGGGTKTDVVCTDEHGTVVGQGTSGPTNLTSTSVGAASFNLLEAIRQSTEQLPEGNIDTGTAAIAHLVMGLAGMDTPGEHERAHQVFTDVLKPYAISKFTLVNDSLIALENATDAADAIVLVSGTGTICFGRNASGQLAKTSGVDYLLADQGSGYYIGRQVLREAVKSFDGRRPKSLLEELVSEYFHISSIEHLKEKVYSPPLNKIEVADLAPLCLTAFERGDEVAKIIVGHTVEELALQAETVIRKLGLGDKPFDCVFAGSVMKVPHIETQVLAALTAQFPQLHLIKTESDPVHGAIKMARR